MKYLFVPEGQAIFFFQNVSASLRISPPFAYRLEIAELAGHRDMAKSFLPQPLIAAPDGGGDGDSNHHLELVNLDLQVN